MRPTGALALFSYINLQAILAGCADTACQTGKLTA
jgi:hypothetical protein